ncbi:MAG: DUF3019 domain-containing protein [Moraxellaceae bacterium]|nr:MAG: DUF3019 domain-containing protein [Moraxellaceae bacterium]
MPFNDSSSRANGAVLRWLAALLLLMELPTYAQADTSLAVELTAKPNKCIALRKGQDCYQTISFKWHTPATGEYCLVAQGQTKPLHCWRGSGTPPFNHEFVGQQSQRFYLLNETGETLQTTEVVVAWVYTSDKRTTGGWRLF